MVEMSEAAKEARRAYNREYYRKNRERLNAYQRQWRASRAEASLYEARKWEKKAALAAQAAQE